MLNQGISWLLMFTVSRKLLFVLDTDELPCLPGFYTGLEPLSLALWQSAAKPVFCQSLQMHTSPKS